MRYLTVILAGLAAACGRPPTIDEACPDKVPGEKFLEDEPSDVLMRISCHRRFVGLNAVRVQEGVQEAVALHARYLQENGILNPLSENFARHDPFTQDAGLPFFTGRSVFDRLRRTNAIDVTASLQVWMIDLPRELVEADGLFDVPWIRDPLFQPLLLGGGYAEYYAGSTTQMHLNLVYSFPAASRVDRPVVYPRDGQVDVPTFWTPPVWWPVTADPIVIGGGRGYPITVTVGSYEGSQGRTNPYDLISLGQSLVDEFGTEYPLVQAGPGRYAWGDNLATLVFASTVPLQPGVTYTFEAEISWNSAERKKVSTTFTTASEGIPGPSDDAL